MHRPWEEKTAWGVARLPGGEQRFWGVPFSVGGAEPEAPGLLVRRQRRHRPSRPGSLDGSASYVIFAHLCDARARTTVAGQSADYPDPVVTAPGEHLADYVLEYADGSRAPRRQSRRRFEVNQVRTRMQSGFVSRPHHGPDAAPDARAVSGRHVGPVPDRRVGRAGRPASPPRARILRGRTHPSPDWSIYALPNPAPEKPLRALRLEPTGAAAIGIGAVTLFAGAAPPAAPRAAGVACASALPAEADRASAAEGAEIDLGVIARRYEASAGRAQTPGSARPSRGAARRPDAPETSLILDLAGSRDATLSVLGREIPLGDVLETGAGQQRRTGRSGSSC